MASRQIRTSDGVRIHYLDRGTGPPMLLIPGLAQTAAQFTHQLDDLASDNRVIAVDLRGHGQSDKPAHGYRISRLAQDVRELVAALELHDLTMVGHSMGASVIWSYWDQFGDRDIANLVLVDQPATLVTDPTRPAHMDESLGTLASPGHVFEVAERIRTGTPVAPDAPAFSATMSDQDRAFFAEQTALLPAEHHAVLLVEHFFNDWRDVIPRISVPTLVIGGAVSVAGQGVHWVAAHISGARLEIFSSEERGSHFMFWENPARFNAIVRDFLVSS